MEKMRIFILLFLIICTGNSLILCCNVVIEAPYFHFEIISLYSTMMYEKDFLKLATCDSKEITPNHD